MAVVAPPVGVAVVAVAWVLPVVVIPALVLPSVSALAEPPPVSEGVESLDEPQASSGLNESTVHKIWRGFTGDLAGPT